MGGRPAWLALSLLPQPLCTQALFQRVSPMLPGMTKASLWDAVLLSLCLSPDPFCPPCFHLRLSESGQLVVPLDAALGRARLGPALPPWFCPPRHGCLWHHPQALSTLLPSPPPADRELPAAQAWGREGGTAVQLEPPGQRPPLRVSGSLGYLGSWVRGSLWA